MSQRINLNTTPNQFMPILYFSQGDIGRTFEIALTSSDGYSIPIGATVEMVATKPSGFGFTVSGSLTGNVATFVTTETMTSEWGRFPAEIVIKNNGDVIGTANFYLNGERNPHPEGTIDGDASTIIPQLTLLVERVETAASSVLDRQTVTQTLPAGSQASYSFDEETNTQTFGIPQGEAGAGAVDVTASAYSSSKTYAVGDYVIHNDYLYRCTTAITTAEAWTSGHWTQVLLGDDVSDVKSALNQVYMRTSNIYNRDADRHGITISGTGVISSDASFKATDYMYVGEGNKVTVQIVNGTYRAFFYTSNDASGFSRALWLTGETEQTVTLSSTEKYLVLLLQEYAPNFMVNLGTTLLPFVPYAVAGAFLEDVIDGIDNKIEAVKDSSAQKNIVNRFDKDTISSGYYLSTSVGTLVQDADFFASDYIDVSDLDKIACSYTHIVCFYDSEKAFISGQGFSTRAADGSISRPNNAKYMRFSTYNGDLNYAQIGADVSRANYVPYGKYTLPDFLANATEKIVVDASGNGDYTSLTEALYDNVDSGVDVIVKAGTYDIVNEYVDLFGQSAVDNMADSDGATFKGFQYGVIIRNRKIEFMSGAHIVCDWSEHTVDGTHRFSALRVDYNAEIIGLDLVSTHTFYAIHDDYGLWDEPYTVKYENCRVKGVNLTNANCIGGGCKPYSRHIINNCHFDNGMTGSTTVRYHNTNSDGAEPEIFVSNCYFNNWFTPRWYGTQTSKMRVYVNNCEARAIYKMAESSSYNVDNVELYKWCNTETNPIT